MTDLIRMGLPSGSLLKRANTDEFLLQAGLKIRGYEKDARSYNPEVLNFDIEPVVARPQEIPIYLSDGRLDIGICGNDWVEDRAIVGKKVAKLADLEYGDVRLVLAVPISLTYVNSVSDFLQKYRGKRVVCSTEYVNTAYDMFSKDPIYVSIYGNKAPTISMEGRTLDCNPNFIIERSGGNTEGKPNSRLADIIIDNTISGTTIKENGLKIIKTIATSTAGLYANPKVLQDKKKSEKIEIIRRMLMGVVKARNYDYVAINFPNLREKVLMTYLNENRLYAKEPSIVGGKEWSLAFVEIPKKKWPTLVEDLYGLGIDDVVRLAPSQIITR